MRVAVVGHVEWVECAEVDHVPTPGEIVPAGRTFQLPTGSGAVAAVQLAKLAGSATLYTALGDDEAGHRAENGLREMGLDVECVHRPEAQRRGFVHLDRKGERTITIFGPRLGASGEDPLAWEQLRETDAVYLTAGDPEAVREARQARALVASVRALETLAEAGIELDVLVASARDPDERYESGDLEPPPRFVVRTMGASGGEWETPAGERGRWDAAPLPGPVRDVYGSGDSFAGGITYGMGRYGDIQRAAELGARCGAACATGRGPYEGQLRSA